jgi:hypothetical protein
MMAHDWGRRLSDRIREALDASDLAGARRLAVEGDGEARNLEKEYALMYRGLGITVRVLLALMPASLGRAPEAGRARAQAAAVALLARFGSDMRAAMARAYGDGVEVPGPEPAPKPDDLEAAVTATRGLLDAGEAAFARAQAQLAAATLAALDTGDAGAARWHVDRKEREQYVPLHDRIIRFMAEVFTWVVRAGGPDELLRFHRLTAEGQRDGFERWERLEPAAFARGTAFLLKQHMGRVRVVEDDEKFTVEQTPCGSGGALRLAGAYEGPGALAMVETPGPLTLGVPRFPVYCSHCPIWNGLAPIEWFGRPHWVFDRPSRPDGSCTLHIYKRRDGAPAGYAQQLGVGPTGR